MEVPTTRGDSSPSSSSSSAEAAATVAASSSHSPSQSHVQEQEQQEHQQQEQQPPNISYRVNISISDSQATSGLRDEAWSCLAVLVTFWFFASMTMILGFYGSVNLQLGPHCSRILQANSLFVHEIKVRAGAESKPGPVLYDFSKPPPLDVETSWLEAHTATVPPNFHKEWIYFLNKGSQVDVSYYVKSTNSTHLSLVIAHGKENLIEWIEEPSYPNTTLSWNIIHGSGVIHQKISKASDYYIAVGNLNQEDVEVQLNFSIKAVQYNTTGAYSKCSLDNNLCVLKLFMFGANAAVLTTPGIEEDSESDQWYVKLSYGPRWVTYFVISGGVTIIMLLAFKIFNKFENRREERVEHQEGDVGPERTPLLNHKDDDALSWGSSYDSVSHDEEDPEDWSGAASLEAKSLKESETNTPRRLCVICYDSPRDCFFLPCGHCATCFTCGTRIAEEASVCPICRRKMKKVRKIFTV